MIVPTTHRLENGDRLARADLEFLCDLQQVENAELIHGVVRMNAAALRFRQHGEPHSFILGWLIAYKAASPDVRVADNVSIRFDERNEPQPDAVMFLPVEQGGGCRIADDGYLEGVPELIVEVAASSVSFDAHEKKDLYESYGVREYILWRTEDHEIDWFLLRNSRYEKQPTDPRGLLRSEVFPSLVLDTIAMINGDIKAVLAALPRIS
jgi:Uma2 family endonuclease